MPKIALIDCEEGYRSISSLVDSGKVVRFAADTFEKADDAVWNICLDKEPYDYVILDTISTLATTTMHDLRGGVNTRIWKNRAAAKLTQAMWGEMSDDLIRLTRQLYTIKGVVIITCHEGEREDPTDGVDMHGPDLNRALLKDLYGMSDAIVRLGRLRQEGTINGTKYPKGTRTLRLQDSPQFMAKGRDELTATPRPEIIAEPTIKKFFEVCNPPPRKILLYGPSGVGKTTLACSPALDV